MDRLTELHPWEVKALLDGASLLVRPLEKQPPIKAGVRIMPPTPGTEEEHWDWWGKYTPYRPGDCLVGLEEYFNLHGTDVYYKADFKDPNAFSPWSPASEMPPALSRIRRTIAGVEVKQVQEIKFTEIEDAGFDQHRQIDIGIYTMEEFREKFSWKFNDIYGPAAWEQNHWAAFIRLEEKDAIRKGAD